MAVAVPLRGQRPLVRRVWVPAFGVKAGVCGEDILTTDFADDTDEAGMFLSVQSVW